MTVRTPVKIDGTSGLIEMSSVDIDNIKLESTYQYALNPSITLAVVSSGGNLGTINDTRKKAGAGSTRVDRFPTQAEAGNVSTVTVGYSKITMGIQSVSAPSTPQGLPVYRDGTSGLREMSTQDFFDTFVLPSIQAMIANTYAQGTYYIAQGNTGLGIVFTDTRANVGAYTAGGINETRDQPTTISNYSLVYRSAATDGGSFNLPLYIDGTSGVREYTYAQFETLLQEFMRYYATQSGSQVSYNINGAGSNQGTGMINTILNGGGNYQTRYVNTDDYRAQEFPNGTAVTADTYFLRQTII